MRLGTVRIVLSVFVAALLAACEQEPTPVAEQPRPIRTVTVNEVASGHARTLSAVVQASDSSSLSFQISGNVREVLVNQGDRVTSGQVLAVLDEEPFQLNVRAARAHLEAVRADLGQAEAEYERQRTLYEQGWVARARYENAERDYRSAASRVDYAVARLNLAQRDLANTTLAAPFDGFVSTRAVDPFVEVQAGQVVFRMDAEGGIEVVMGVPETTISEITLGMPVSVRFPQVSMPVEALITEIASTAGTGNTFPVNAALIDPPANVRPGMSAEVTMLLAGDDSTSGYLVPLSAIAPGDRSGEGFIFVYDPGTGTVRRTLVEPTDTLVSNVVAVTGVKVGDIVATAGVNFLVDGQAVTLIEPVDGNS